MRLKPLLPVAALVALGLAMPLGTAAAFSPDETRQLAAGEPVVDVQIDMNIDAARVRATIDIPAAPELVWKVMVDCDRAVRFVPGLETCRVTARDPAGRWDIREHKINWAWFLPRVRTVIHSDYDAPRLLRFRLIEGDLRVSKGDWRLEPQAGGRGTRVSYQATLGADVPVPGFVVAEVLRNDMATIMRKLRTECTAKDHGKPPS